MTNVSPKSLIGTFAFVAMLSAPLAFAQEAEAALEQSTAAETAAGSPPAAAPATSAGQLSWADVDTDQDGNISTAEAAAVPALTQMFNEIDANADGMLTAEEYQTFAEGGQGAGAEAGAEAEADADVEVEADAEPWDDTEQ
ncbi:EF-hand domain-containing protein [Lysobacter sp. D1-1-M9]|uniref:EF-hand domain-containing protein n=1 Tax=Novilysobacter longmucuonensis TaxID=3098603 RepID=UPI002FC9FEDD